MSETKAVPALGVNHLVLQVRDIEASHKFYTEGLGFEQIGALSPDFPMTMRFYACRPGSHHDIALIQMTDPEAAPPVKPFNLMAQGSINAINHYAVAYTRENFLKQLEYMKASGVEFMIRGEHGMTHSCYVQDPDGNGIEILYELPAEVWEQDINGALNYFVPTATEGEEALTDNADYKVFTAPNA
ncbi:MAG: VOC family protein [Acidimicrobiia bacterium]